MSLISSLVLTGTTSNAFNQHTPLLAVFLFLGACVHGKSLQSRLTLCDPMDCCPPGSSVHGILQARILEWVALPSSRGSPQPRDQTCVSYVSCIASGFFTTSPTWEVPFRGTHYQLILKVSRLLGPYLWFLSLS